MDKFYVASGDLQTVILAINEDDAAKRFIKRAYSKDDDTQLGEAMQVSRKGFAKPGSKGHAKDLFYATAKIAELVGIILE
jgi:hypothetical protein